MNNSKEPLLITERKKFHDDLCKFVLNIDNGIASNADSSQRTSKFLALHIAKALGASESKKAAGQNMGNNFEKSVETFLKSSIIKLSDINPGKWEILQVGSRTGMEIAKYNQYSHLKDISEVLKNNKTLAASLGNDYSIAPDIIISRKLLSDEEINKHLYLIDNNVATLADIRDGKDKFPILHASVSTKWTLRSDRAQNARSEALNLIRNRKGRNPHIVVVTGEPTPSRLSSIALGTGDIDCVYHFALYELLNAANELNNDEVLAMLDILITGKRLKDISDLPLDLAL